MSSSLGDAWAPVTNILNISRVWQGIELKILASYIEKTSWLILSSGSVDLEVS